MGPRTIFWSRLLVGIGLTLGCAAVSVAQDTSYVLVPGIAGESVDAAHPGWIEAYGLNHVSTSSGGAPVHDKIAVLKGTDTSTPQLFDRLSRGSDLGTVTIEVCRNPAGGAARSATTSSRSRARRSRTSASPGARASTPRPRARRRRPRACSSRSPRSRGPTTASPRARAAARVGTSPRAGPARAAPDRDLEPEAWGGPLESDRRPRTLPLEHRGPRGRAAHQRRGALDAGRSCFSRPPRGTSWRAARAPVPRELQLSGAAEPSDGGPRPRRRSPRPDRSDRAAPAGAAPPGRDGAPAPDETLASGVDPVRPA